jgi:hypothetical protein
MMDISRICTELFKKQQLSASQYSKEFCEPKKIINLALTQNPALEGFSD